MTANTTAGRATFATFLNIEEFLLSAPFCGYPSLVAAVLEIPRKR
jgi:hypothetical protein